MADRPALSEGARWRRSDFTRRVELGGGDIALYNSFMGAIVWVKPLDVAVLERCLATSFVSSEVTSPLIDELCDRGFFVPTDLPERELAETVLAHEREAGLHLILLPHENCNFRCTYCYETFARGKMRRGVVEGLKRLVERRLAEVDNLSVAWFGGEPLLAQDVVLELSETFLEACARHGAHYSSGMTTNGALLTPVVMNKMLAARVTAYQVTLDGPEALHDASRRTVGGRGTYRKILNNISAAKGCHDSFTMKIRVNFGRKHTPESMAPFFEELVAIIGKDSRFDLHFHPMGRWGGPQDDALEVCHVDDATVRRQALMSAAQSWGMPLRMAQDHLRPHGNVCYAGKDSSMVIGSDGTIYKCTVAFEDPRNQVGHLLSSGHTIIDDEKWKLWTTLEGKESAKCGSCNFSPTCQSRGCPLAAINQGSPPCPLPSAEIDQSIRLMLHQHNGPQPPVLNR